MKHSRWTIDGSVVKENDTYTVIDNTDLKNLVVSSTRLHSNQNTTGHKHPGQEEVYIFISGYGHMQLDETEINVQTGDTVLIEDGVFHKVFNDSPNEDLYFICVFDGKRSH